MFRNDDIVVTGNRLIAEFMGLTPVKTFGRFSITKDHCTSNCLISEDAMAGFGGIAKYKESWDWLMPVISKITRDECFIDNEYRESIMDVTPYGLIEDTYYVDYVKNKVLINNKEKICQ